MVIALKLDCRRKGDSPHQPSEQPKRTTECKIIEGQRRMYGNSLQDGASKSSLSGRLTLHSIEE